MNTFRLVTITHKTASISHIGKYIPAVNADPKQLAIALKRVKVELNICELLYMATCNRLTFLMSKSQPINESFLLRLFEILNPNLPKKCLQDLLDVVAIHEGGDCVRHIFEVASSLDSLVVGEREILGQLKNAYEFSRKAGLTGDKIRLLMKIAVPTAKQVYTQTKIGQNRVSIVSLAAQKMMEHYIPKTAKFLIVGAGQTNTLIAKFLLKYQFNNFAIFNRSIHNAKRLAEKLDGKAYPLTALADYQEGFDVIITCTGSANAIFTDKLYESLLNGDTNQKVIIDLAVPTDVSPNVLRKFNIRYIAVDQLRALAAENLALRKLEVHHAHKIIDRRLDEFKVSLRKRRVERGMSEIPERVRAIKDRASIVFEKEINAMDEDSKEALQKILAYMEKKYIGIPISVARDVLEKELMLVQKPRKQIVPQQ